jgi:hypothetical protein
MRSLLFGSRNLLKQFGFLEMKQKNAIAVDSIPLGKNDAIAFKKTQKQLL